MKPFTHQLPDRAGYLLIECLVYLAVFAVVVGLSLEAFYVCWDHAKALRYATDDITAALHAGERWRADVRSATGAITVEPAPDGEILHIPQGTNELNYRFRAGEIQRQLASSSFSETVLAPIKSSAMLKETRGAVTAWRWEVELTPRRKETHLPLVFTFEAATGTAP